MPALTSTHPHDIALWEIDQNQGKELGEVCCLGRLSWSHLYAVSILQMGVSGQQGWVGHILTWRLTCRLTSLRRLSLQSNRLVSMAGFEHCIHLEELYLSHNGISKLEVRIFLEDLMHVKHIPRANHCGRTATVCSACRSSTRSAYQAS